MAEKDDEPRERADSGSRDRATVALVDAKVDGIKDLMRAEFGYIRERIEPLAGAIKEIALLKSQGEDHERRIEALEGNRRHERDWKRDRLPTLLISGFVALVGLAALLIPLFSR